PMLDVEFVQLLQDMIGDLTSAPEPLVIKLFSQDPVLLKKWAPQVGEAIKKVHGVVDVLDGIENTISGPATMFKVDQAMAARAGGGGGPADDRGPPSAVQHPRRLRRRLRGAAEVVQGSAGRPRPRGSAGVHRAAVRVRRFRGAGGGDRVGAAFDDRGLRRAPG